MAFAQCLHGAKQHTQKGNQQYGISCRVGVVVGEGKLDCKQGDNHDAKHEWKHFLQQYRAEINRGLLHETLPPCPIVYHERFTFTFLFKGIENERNIEGGSWTMDALSVWSPVHGFTVMLVNNIIAYEGTHADAVETMVRKLLR